MNQKPNPDLESLTRKAILIAGTPLLNIAWQAKSPSQAAKIVAHLGHGKKKIQATRWAAIIAREERRKNFPEGSFWQNLGPHPYSEVDFPRQEPRCFSFEVFCKGSNSWDALNAAERRKILSVVSEAIRPYGIRVQKQVLESNNEPEATIRFTHKDDE